MVMFAIIVPIAVLLMACLANFLILVDPVVASVVTSIGGAWGSHTHSRSRSRSRKMLCKSLDDRVGKVFCNGLGDALGKILSRSGESIGYVLPYLLTLTNGTAQSSQFAYDGLLNAMQA